jgi:hypothetical protein
MYKPQHSRQNCSYFTDLRPMKSHIVKYFEVTEVCDHALESDIIHGLACCMKAQMSYK